MQAGVGLLVSDVMPIYMIIPRYSHNYAQFCQLFNINLFTHRRILMLSREATSETYGPRVYLYHIDLLLLSYFLCYLLFLYFTLHLYHKNTKKIITRSRRHENIATRFAHISEALIHFKRLAMFIIKPSQHW